ncbi:hypothetical protein GCM10023221_27010 [Luteimicrobium xylanilyticum]
MNGHCALRGRVEQSEKVQQGRLASAGGPDDGEPFPTPDLELYVTQRFDRRRAWVGLS